MKYWDKEVLWKRKEEIKYDGYDDDDDDVRGTFWNNIYRTNNLFL